LPDSLFFISVSSLQVPDNKSNGGEGGILLPPFLASYGDAYTFAIIPCVYAGYKRNLSSVPVSIVSAICCSSAETGITGISAHVLDRTRHATPLGPPEPDTQERLILLTIAAFAQHPWKDVSIDTVQVVVCGVPPFAALPGQ
jgi:hypothetical protein